MISPAAPFLHICRQTCRVDLGDAESADLHRGLRQPALLLALAKAVQDNDAGSAAQRAAGSALVAFCDVRNW